MADLRSDNKGLTAARACLTHLAPTQGSEQFEVFAAQVIVDRVHADIEASTCSIQASQHKTAKVLFLFVKFASGLHVGSSS
jgi:hypothetical protein